MAKILSNKIINLLNIRINEEELSSRLYLAMSIWLNKNGFSGASTLFKKYSDEELLHADKGRSYLLDLDVLPQTNVIKSVVEQYDSLVTIIQQAYEHEIKITNQCEELAKACNDESDFMSLNVALWYLNEQTEELAKTKYWLDRLEAFGSDTIALRLLDNEMGEA